MPMGAAASASSCATSRHTPGTLTCRLACRKKASPARFRSICASTAGEPRQFADVREWIAMNAENLMNSLERFAGALPALVRDVADADARWKPPDDAWSILEIIMHLCDEEVDDFRTRIRLTLENPGQDWPAIEPERWARDRKYNEADLHRALDRFVRERHFSVEWLRSLGDVDWTIAHTHPKIGTLRAGDLLASWAAHDALHLRQIAKRMHQLAQFHASEFRTEYAGPWGP